MAQRIVVGARIGFDEPQGIWWSHNVPSDLDIDASNDGAYTANAPQFTIDLSKLAAKYLGYQASMMSGYRIHRIKVGVRPVDDIVDNDAYAFFAGHIDMFPATEHGKKALQLARKVEKADESNQVDNDSLFLTDDNDYSGFRYGWNVENSITGQGPQYMTGNGVTGMSNSWLLSEIFGAYDTATASPKTNALFGGRAPEKMSTHWVCGWTSGTESTGNDSGVSQDSNTHYSLDVLPLLQGQVYWTSGDEDGAVDDDYQVLVEIEFTPEIRGTF